jgi:hypothetical protein
MSVVCVRVLLKSEMHSQKCGKYTDIKFRENPSDGIRAVPRGQTDRRDEVT